jgi:hypothetical protein
MGYVFIKFIARKLVRGVVVFKCVSTPLVLPHSLTNVDLRTVEELALSLFSNL